MANIINTISNWPAVQQACLFCKVFWRVAKVLGFGGIGGWMIYRSTDKITIAVGVTLCFVALVELVSVAYKAEYSTHKAPKNKK